jgi:hypothetical protein
MWFAADHSETLEVFLLPTVGMALKPHIILQQDGAPPH